ncbi:argonaute-like protein [Dichomitus squalens]|nr:argonaute-like protein [Dichomitus squalens]
MERGRGQGRGGRGGDRGYRGRGGPPSGSIQSSDSYSSRGASPGGGRGSSPGGDRGGYRGGDRGGYRGGFRGDRSGSRGGSRGGRGSGSRGRGGVFAPDRPAVVDPRLTDNSQDQLVVSLRSLRLNDNDLPVRPGFGTAGSPIKLRTNFFPLTLPKTPFYEYDVQIDPPAGNKRLKRRIFQLAEQTKEWKRANMTGRVAHDNSAKLLAVNKLPQPLQIKFLYSDEDEEEQRERDKAREPKEYTMTIKFQQLIDTEKMLRYLNGDPQQRMYDFMPVVNAMNIILSAHPNRVVGGGVMVGRNKFFHPSPSAPPVPLGGGLEAWRGFYSSVRPAWKQLMVNVNVCTTAFYTPGNLADRMIEFMNLSPTTRLRTFVRSVRVKTTHLGYRKTVKGLANVNARQHKFTAEGMGEVTVEQYFQRKYKIKLRYPDLPLIDVGGQRTNYLPAEVCMILEKQPYQGKVPDELTANMLLVACQYPNVNGDAITNRGLLELGLSQSPPPVNAFGITVGSEMAVVPGRILPPPVVRYAQGTGAVDDRASWNLRGVRFALGARLQNWGVLLIHDGNGRDEFSGADDPELGNVLRGFADMCKKSGMSIDQAPPQIAVARLPPRRTEDPLRKQAVKQIRETLMGIPRKPSIVLVILSNGDRHIYSGLKHLCDVYLDVATVCVHAAKIRKGAPTYYANVALKFNTKLGGINHELGEQNMAWLSREPTMLVGMDVTHPGTGTVRGTPSIAAVVASIDRRMGQFPASMRLQESRKEMITDLASMMEERLQAFRAKNNKTLPSRVLVYRDGVSEGQFSIVVAEEMPEIRKAFAKFGPTYKPKLTIVICGKRHHTRFFPMDPAHAAQDGNPKPGTVVDRGVTAVYEYDFYLQAHGGLQGTTRPTHYYVVHDEIGIGADQLQCLTNDISYMFARATKAVSLVSPAYYADLACERGRCYIHPLLQGHSDSGATATSDGGEEEVMNEAKKMWRFDNSPNAVGGALKETMFYI